MGGEVGYGLYTEGEGGLKICPISSCTKLILEIGIILSGWTVSSLEGCDRSKYGSSGRWETGFDIASMVKGFGAKVQVV
jgi:hypothetical protein